MMNVCIDNIKYSTMSGDQIQTEVELTIIGCVNSSDVMHTIMFEGLKSLGISEEDFKNQFPESIPRSIYLIKRGI